MKILAVYDKVHQSYETPFAKENEQIAIREFSIAVRDPNTMLSQFPTDYELHELGTFDQSTGKYQHKVGGPLCLITAQACITLNNVAEKNAALANKIKDENPEVDFENSAS